MTGDPRGPSRLITKVEESPTGGPTFLVLSCGHRAEVVNHFSYRVGTYHHCFACRKEGRQWPCPVLQCSGVMLHWKASVRWLCPACGRFFDFVAVPLTVDPRDRPREVALDGARDPALVKP